MNGLFERTHADKNGVELQKEDIVSFPNGDTSTQGQIKALSFRTGIQIASIETGDGQKFFKHPKEVEFVSR